MFTVSNQTQLNRANANSQNKENSGKIENCQYCGHNYDQNSIVGNNLVCKKCGMYHDFNDTDQKLKRHKYYFLGSLLAGFSIVIIFLNWQNLALQFFPKKYMQHLKYEQTIELQNKCLNDNNLKCLVFVYQRILDFKPNEELYLANLAFTYTKLTEYRKAQPIYEKLIQSGVGAIDLMYQYAYNSEQLGQTDLAIRWYEKTLEIDDRYIDLTLSLAKLYAEEKRFAEAVSLLVASINKYPKVKKLLTPSLSVILEQIRENPNQNVSLIKLVSVEGSHAFVPLRLAGTYESYLIDTGASRISAPTEDIKKSYPDLMRFAVKAKAMLADQRVIDVYTIKVPELHFANWKFQNVEVTYCDQCARLVGMNLLSQMNMSYKKQGQLQYFQFERKMN